MTRNRTSPAQRLVDLGADAALWVGGWALSVGILNFLVGSPLTEIYIGVSIASAAMLVGWRAAKVFEEPPHSGSLRLFDEGGRILQGSVSPDGEIRLHGPGGRVWSGKAWAGRWTLTDPDGSPWWGRVNREGAVEVHDEKGCVLHGTLTPDDESAS